MRRSVKIFWITLGVLFLCFALLIVAVNEGMFGDMPSIKEIENPTANVSTQIYARDGSPMGRYFLEDRVSVAYNAISPYLIKALMATEDERFYSHSGIDARSMLRALVYFGRAGGASTITMQTAKNLFTDNPSKNILTRMLQKLKEAIIAIKLERNFTKEEIITLYLNTVAFGDNVYGVKTAARTFFQKESNNVTIDEAAVLIGMLKGNYTYNPRVNPKKALDRRNVVIDQLVRNGYASEAEAAMIKRKSIVLNYRKMDENTGLAPYFRMVIGEEIKKWCKEHRKINGDNYDLYRDGLKIYTTIDPRMQMYAEEAVAKHLSFMQRILNSQENIQTGSVWATHENVLRAAMLNSDRWRRGKKNDMTDEDLQKTFFKRTKMRVFVWNQWRQKDTVMTPYDSIKYMRQMLQAAFVAIDPSSGEVLAWVGGINYKDYKLDHVGTSAARQVGSTIKPILYAFAMEETGMTPNSIVHDEQQSFGMYGMVPATPKTCSGDSVTMANALAFSRNCASAFILKSIDDKGNNAAIRFADFLNNKCDVSTHVAANPSIALGACELSLYDMLHTYSMFPGHGTKVKPIYIKRIEDKNGNILATFYPTKKEVINEVTAYAVVKMMQEVTRIGTASGIWGYGVAGEIAGKTGTTNDNSDAWFMGYTPTLLAGVWVGCDDRFIHIRSEAMGQGSQAAMPIWAYFYDKCLQDKSIRINTAKQFSRPASLVQDIQMLHINKLAQRLAPEGSGRTGMGTGTSDDYDIPNFDLKTLDITQRTQPTRKTPDKKQNNIPVFDNVEKIKQGGRADSK